MYRLPLSRGPLKRATNLLYQKHVVSDTAVGQWLMKIGHRVQRTISCSLNFEVQFSGRYLQSYELT